MERCQNVAVLNWHTTGYSETTRLQWNDIVEHCPEFLFRRAWEFLDQRSHYQIFLEKLFVLEFVKLKLTVTNAGNLWSYLWQNLFTPSSITWVVGIVMIQGTKVCRLHVAFFLKLMKVWVCT